MRQHSISISRNLESVRLKTQLIAASLLACAQIAFAEDVTTPQSKLGEPAISAMGRPEPTPIPVVVISATRNPQLETKLGSAFTRVSEQKIARAQDVDLQQALDTIPGVVAVDAGARGGFASVSIRGNRPSDTLILLDGVRINTGVFQNAEPFLAYAGSSGLESIEVLRGPQSTLYGSEGIGGVITLETKRGEGTPSLDFLSEAGSFDSFRESVGSQGAFGKADYSFSYERDDSQNKRQNNDLSINRYSLRLDYQILDDLSLRLNVVGLDGHYQEPGSARPQDFASNDPGSHTVGQSNLVDAIIQWKVLRQWTQKLTLGLYFEHYGLVDPPYAGNFFFPTNYFSNAINYSADWQNTVQIASNNRLTAGLAFNEFTGHDNSFSQTSISDFAAYIQDEWTPVKHLDLTAGTRFDHYQKAGDALTYRFTGAYLFPTDTKIRASYGTAFKVPSLFQLYSNSTSFLGAAGLRPEKSSGWDAGIDQYLCNRNVVLSASYFQNDIRDLIALVETSSVTGFFVNRDTAENHGVELAAQMTLLGEWRTRLAYTWLRSTYTSAGVTLRREQLPENELSLDTNYLIFQKWLVGCGLSFMAGRVDKDFSVFPASQVKLQDYCTGRIYSRYTVNDRLAIFFRAENIASTRYENALGYPGLPFGAYGGVDLKF